MVNFLMNYYNIIFLKYQMSHKNVSFKKSLGAFILKTSFPTSYLACVAWRSSLPVGQGGSWVQFVLLSRRLRVLPCSAAVYKGGQRSKPTQPLSALRFFFLIYYHAGVVRLSFSPPASASSQYPEERGSSAAWHREERPAWTPKRRIAPARRRGA